MSGKTIRIFLADGSPTGILTAEVMNWTGMILVSPRSLLPELAKRDEVSRTGRMVKNLGRRPKLFDN